MRLRVEIECMLLQAELRLNSPEPMEEKQVAYTAAVIGTLKWVLLKSEKSPLL